MLSANIEKSQNSATQRVKNHLAYKLGLAMIAYDMTTTGGGGFSKLLLTPKFLFTLRSIKKEHKRLNTLYKDITNLFPQLKNPDLKTYPDYTKARLVKFHLAYLLGQALMNADKTLFQGGYLRLGKDIKKAKVFYKNSQKLKKIFKKLFLNEKLLANILENQGEVFKYLIKNSQSDESKILLKTLSLAQNHVFQYEDISLEAQNFIFENLQEIHTWLTSNEFKEKYLNTKHPYPPLLNPASLNDKHQKSNYHNISANSAWEMNLPFLSHYNFVFFASGATAHGTIAYFLQKMLGLKTISISHYDLKKNIKEVYQPQNVDLLTYFCMFLEWEKIDYKFHFFVRDTPFIILVRDPISRLKTMVNHGCSYLHPKLFSNSFTFKEDPSEVVERNKILYHNEKLESGSTLPDIASTKGFVKASHNMNYAYTSIANICQKEVYYIDMSEFMPDKIMQSLPKYAKFFNKSLSQEFLEANKAYLQEIKWNELASMLPFNTKIPFAKGVDLSVSITFKQQIPSDFKDFSNELFDENLDILNIVAFAMKENEFELLKSDENLFKEVRTYLYQFALELTKVRQEQLDGRKNEKDILEYFKQHKDVALEFKALLDKELTHIKAHRPDIVASWKYYNEFEKICKEFYPLS